MNLKKRVVDKKLIINITNKNSNRVIKNTKLIINLCDKNSYKLKFDFIEKIKDEEKLIELKNIEKAVNIKDINKRYSFIYDSVCEYIDNKDDVCIYFRYHKNFEHKNGCCFSDARGGLCENLVNNACKIKSISCKLYSCEYLRKNKVNFKMKNIPLIKYFFNIKQQYYIKYSFFKDKNYVMNKLIENK